MTRPRSAPVPWRDLLPTVLIPNLIYNIGQSAAIPAMPLAAIALGASYSTAAVVVAVFTIGQLVVNLPAGWLVGRFGEKPVMVASIICSGIGGLGGYLATNVAALIVAAALLGAGAAIFTMARHSWITSSVAPSVRGRALSSVAGFNRLGSVAGPFLAAGAFHVTGDVGSAFLAVVVASFVVLLVLAFVRFPSQQPDLGGEAIAGVLHTMWLKRALLLRFGLVVSVVSTMRLTRRVLVPLVGIAVGLDDVQIALVVGVATAVEFCLFYLGGVLIDRAGRVWVAVTTLTGYGVAHFVLAASTELDSGVSLYLLSALLIALSNGISGGLVATIGSDLADPRAPSAFLGSWRLVTEVGPSLAPLLIGGVSAIATLGLASGIMGLVSLAAAAGLPRLARKYLPGVRVS